LLSTAHHLEKEGKYNDLNNAQQKALNLLQHVNAVAAHIPGSQASKIFVRNEIRSYSAYFGLPHIYFTANPSATHSPIFQVIFGDKTVDLSKRFPQLVSSRERALRLAQDTVAAADFFQFSIKCIFKYLFGWNYNTQSSTKEGGILGHLKAFYGTAELTERGNFHGHFLLWLLGGLNPTELHRQLKEDSGFKKHFFDFFEDTIHHHLPEIEGNVDPAFEPRVERPILPPTSKNPAIEGLKTWESAFVTEIKKCGEILQCHVCKPVCHKYGNNNQCRFLFPHEIVEASYFDTDTNSVVLMCRDSTVNYFNPYILVFCRHNHDIKCILSGKAAKAAMFYISDYITKMDAKTHEMLSLLSRAVSTMPELNSSSPIANAKILLHKCLAQFTRQQQIHSQQAARYIRRLGDSMSSHGTKPMMSAILIYNVKSIYLPPNSVDFLGGEEDEEDENTEKISLCICIDKEGNLMTTNQFHDYYYQVESLASMNFYDFCHSVKLESNIYLPKNTIDNRLGVFARHQLLQPHKLARTHHLLEYWNKERGDGLAEYVSRPIGCSVPRPNTGTTYAIFALAHFKPFSVINPLLCEGETFDNVFKKYQFTDTAKFILNNWDAINECEDARDAERIKKRAAMATQSQALTKSLFFDEMDIPLVDPSESASSSSKIDFAVRQHMFLLE